MSQDERVLSTVDHLAGRLGHRFGTEEIGFEKSLPTRLNRIADLPWHECWIQQLRSEKKSSHTIRAYDVAAKGFSTTKLPGEKRLDWKQASSITTGEFHLFIDPNNGRMDSG